jgi:4-hydroxybenzoate polyprenyltransferase
MASEPPLCVDLDGTLIRGDTLHESILLLLKSSVWHFLLLPIWLLKGRAHFKARIAARVSLDARFLPYDQALIAELAAQRAAGRSIVLATAANETVAQGVAEHLGVFDRIFASDSTNNLKGSRKAERLVAAYGERGFDYIGDSAADLKVWAVARNALLARPARALERRFEATGRRFERVYGTSPGPSLLSQLPRMLRLHQWLKNGLIFVPLVTSLSFLRIDFLLKGALAFLIFSLCASSVYITNDLLDLASDRRHARKRLRPFASGNVSIPAGIVLASVLLLVGGLLAFEFMPPLYIAVLVAYMVATLAYSFYLKGVVLVDVLILAGLYTSRIIAGAFAVGIEPSFWLLAFSMFVFLSLALIKRFSELQEAAKAGVVWIAGRGYKSTDIQLLMSFGTAAGYVAVLVLALYINSDEVRLLYARPHVLWLLCPLLLYWIARMWIQAERSNMHDDPLVFAARDRITYAVAALGGAAIVGAAWPEHGLPGFLEKLL